MVTFLPSLKTSFLSLLQFLFPLSSVPMISLFLTFHLSPTPPQSVPRPAARMTLLKYFSSNPPVSTHDRSRLYPWLCNNLAPSIFLSLSLQPLPPWRSGCFDVSPGSPSRMERIASCSLQAPVEIAHQWRKFLLPRLCPLPGAGASYHWWINGLRIQPPSSDARQL